MMGTIFHRRDAEARRKAFVAMRGVALPEMLGFALVSTSIPLRLCASAVQEGST